MNILLIIILIISILFLILPFPDEKKFRGYAPQNIPWDHPMDVNDILTDQECREIISIAEPKFSRSAVVGNPHADADRTSETAWIPKTHPLAQKVLLRACELSGKDIENCEDLQVVRYKPGTFYRPHHDSCCEDTDACREFEKKGGQRVGTLLVYLNNDFTDGSTHFPNLNKLFRSPRGNGVFFRPMDPSGKQCHINALHGGMPPTSGTKYLCNAWVRENNVV